MIVKPKPGLKVRDPKSMQHIPAEGIEVPDGDKFWTRRLLAGDVELVPPKPAEKKG